MGKNVSTYTPGIATEIAPEHVVVPSEWTEIEETRPLAFAYVAIASLFGVIASAWVGIYLLG